MAGRRKVGWNDESVSSGFSDHKDQQYKGEKGVKHILRICTECEEYRVHEVDDVFKNNDGEYITFNIVCGKHWDEEAEDWAGDCLACDKEYDAKTKFIAGVLMVGVIKGKSEKPAAVEPHQSVFYWAFGNDKYEQLRDLYFGLKQAEEPKRLKDVELMVTCGKAKDAVQFQKLNITIWQGKTMTTKAHKKAAIEGMRALMDAASAPTKPAEMKRRLKKKREAEPDDDEEEEEEEEDRPKRTKKKTSKKKTKKKTRRKKEPDPEPEDEEEEEEEEEEEDEGTGDPEMDALMDEI